MISLIHYYFSKSVFALVLFASFLTSCKNELDVNAEYDAQAIVYAVINPYDSIQTFRISKTFAGEADPMVYAQVEDSSYFNDVSLKLVEVMFGQDGRSWDLIETTINNKQSGTFFGPEQKLYELRASKNPQDNFYLNPEAEFRLEGTVDGKEIGGKFEIIKEQTGNSAFFLRSSNKFSRFWRGNVSFINGATVNELTFELDYPVGTKVAGLQMIFNYTEAFATGAREKQMVFDLGEQIIANSEEPKTVTFKFSGERFFERIGSQLTDVSEEKDLLYRKSGAVEFRMIAVTEDLFYYRQVKNASDGIAQDRPEYTNVDNGFGVMAGRQMVTMNEQLKVHGGQPIEVLLNKATEQELVTGLLLGSTGGKGFCADPSHNLGSISCP